MCKMCCKLCGKILVMAIILIAVVMAIVVSVWHEQGLSYIVFVSRFFDVMLPVLAVGSLLKYLLSGGSCCCFDKEESSCQKADKK